MSTLKLLIQIAFVVSLCFIRPILSLHHPQPLSSPTTKFPLSAKPHFLQKNDHFILHNNEYIRSNINLILKNILKYSTAPVIFAYTTNTKSAKADWIANNDNNNNPTYISDEYYIRSLFQKPLRSDEFDIILNIADVDHPVTSLGLSLQEISYKDRIRVVIKSIKSSLAPPAIRYNQYLKTVANCILVAVNDNIVEGFAANRIYEILKPALVYYPVNAGGDSDRDSDTDGSITKLDADEKRKYLRLVFRNPIKFSQLLLPSFSNLNSNIQENKDWISTTIVPSSFNGKEQVLMVRKILPQTLYDNIHTNDYVNNTPENGTVYVKEGDIAEIVFSFSLLQLPPALPANADIVDYLKGDTLPGATRIPLYSCFNGDNNENNVTSVLRDNSWFFAVGSNAKANGGKYVTFNNNNNGDNSNYNMMTGGQYLDTLLPKKWDTLLMTGMVIRETRVCYLPSSMFFKAAVVDTIGVLRLLNNSNSSLVYLAVTIQLVSLNGYVSASQ